MTNRLVLDEFGASFISDIRDRVIEKYDKTVAKKAKSQSCIEISNMLDQFSNVQKQAIRKLIINTVDDALHNTLWFIEQNEDTYDLIVSKSEAKYNLVKESDGLCGELYSEDGWIQQYSKYAHSE